VELGSGLKVWCLLDSVDDDEVGAEDGLPSPSSLGGAAEYGAHLPLADLGATPSLASLKTYARAADALGYTYLCANDHLLFSRPWLDGPTALAAVIEESGSMQLATTVSRPVLRGPVPLAKRWVHLMFYQADGW